MRGTPTVVIEEEEEESVHDGDEDATPERDSETRVTWVSPAWSRGLKFPPSGLKTVESGGPGNLRDPSGPRGQWECAGMENGTEHERKEQVGWGTSVVGSLGLEPWKHRH